VLDVNRARQQQVYVQVAAATVAATTVMTTAVAVTGCISIATTDSFAGGTAPIRHGVAFGPHLCQLQSMRSRQGKLLVTHQPQFIGTDLTQLTLFLAHLPRCRGPLNTYLSQLIDTRLAFLSPLLPYVPRRCGPLNTYLSKLIGTHLAFLPSFLAYLLRRCSPLNTHLSKLIDTHQPFLPPYLLFLAGRRCALVARQPELIGAGLALLPGLVTGGPRRRGPLAPGLNTGLALRLLLIGPPVSDGRNCEQGTDEQNKRPGLCTSDSGWC
jgi:hypothetical protein